MQVIVKAYDGSCCACVAHHRKHGKLPHCLREQEQ